MQSDELIASDARRVHRGTLAGGPFCGCKRSGDWAEIDANTAETAVLDFNLKPCTRCIDRHRELERWRKAIHDAVDIDADPPDRWVQKFDRVYGDAAREGSA